MTTGKAILKGLGYTVADAHEECCGGTLLSAGLRSSALSAMEANVRAWRDVGRPLITTACTSCQYSLAKYVQYEELFDSDEEAGRWRDSLVNLASLWGGTTFQVEAPPASLHWHAPCHGTVCKDDEAWLKRTAGKAVSTPAGIHCCGLGGRPATDQQGSQHELRQRMLGSHVPAPGRAGPHRLFGLHDPARVGQAAGRGCGALAGRRAALAPRPTGSLEQTQGKSHG